MSYLQDFEKELREKLSDLQEEDLTDDEFIQFMKDKVLESYKNGMEVKKKTKPAKKEDAPKEEMQKQEPQEPGKTS